MDEILQIPGLAQNDCRGGGGLEGSSLRILVLQLFWMILNETALLYNLQGNRAGAHTLYLG